MGLFSNKGKKHGAGEKPTPEQPIQERQSFAEAPRKPASPAAPGSSFSFDARPASPQQPSTPSSSGASTSGVSVDFTKDSIDRIEQGSRGGVPPQGVLVDGSLTLKANESARVKQFVTPTAGKKYCVTFKAKAVADSTNGVGLNYFVGPLMLNSNGEIIRWWIEQKAISIKDGVVEGSVEFVAPQEATHVFIAWSGPRATKEGQHPSNGRVGIVSSTLTIS